MAKKTGLHPLPFPFPHPHPPPSVEHLMWQVWLRNYIFHFICIVLSLNGHMCLVVSILDSRDLHSHRSQALFGPHSSSDVSVTTTVAALGSRHLLPWAPGSTITWLNTVSAPLLCHCEPSSPSWSLLMAFSFSFYALFFLKDPLGMPTQQQPVSTQICLSTQQHITSKASCLVLELLARLFFTNKQNLSK